MACNLVAAISRAKLLSGFKLKKFGALYVLLLYIPVGCKISYDQMTLQFGVSFPYLPSKMSDLKTPPNAQPANETNPDGNWTDEARHTVTRSCFGSWNNYDGGHTDAPDWPTFFEFASKHIQKQ
ncbi:hypothetical protein JXA70_05420 [candidate division KSB1 bacterium]|nr:hypothetical protein [candidate division KSB1 bacterium]